MSGARGGSAKNTARRKKRTGARHGNNANHVLALDAATSVIFHMWVRMEGSRSPPPKKKNLNQRVGRITPSQSPREREEKKKGERATQQVETVRRMSQV